MNQTDQRSSMLQLVKTRHSRQFRNGRLRTPYWEHCYGVATILEDTLNENSPEVDPRTKEVLYLAALGHDLYEDTTTKRDEIVTKYGPEVDALIDTLTNHVSDTERENYMQQLTRADDKAVLIKLADFVNNVSSVVANQQYLDKTWVHDFFLPIVSDTLPVLEAHVFDDKWRASSLALLKMAREAYDKLLVIA